MAAPVALFQGYHSVVGVGLSTAVEGQTVAMGGTSFVKFDICTTTTELMDSLEVEQSLSVGFVDVASVSQKLQLVNSLKRTTFSTSIVVFARHTQSTVTATQVSLQPAVAAPTDDGQLQNFVMAFGDSYLSSRTIGGEYYAVYTYYSSSQEEQRELTVQMEGAGIFKGVSVDASLQVNINNLNKTQTRRNSFEQRMSGIANPAFPASDGITKFALQFPSMELTAPVMIQWSTSGYERIPQIGRTFSPIASNRELLAGRDASIALSRFRDLQEAIIALRKVYECYGGYAGDTKLGDVEAEVKQDQEVVRRLVAAYRENPTQPLQGPLALQSLRHGSPSLQYKVKLFGEDKGYGHTDFDDVDVASYIAQHRRITAIQLRASLRVVSCIVVTYTDDLGSRTYTYGSHGYNEGSVLSRELILRPDRFINVVSFHYGTFQIYDSPIFPVVSRLEVRLDNDESIASIAGGTPVGESLDWSGQADGTFLMGFRGRAGGYLNMLQIVYAVFNPAKWSV